MSNKTVTMSRELIEEVVAQLDDFITGDVLGRLKSALAVPVVERQEPVGFVTRRSGKFGAWLHSSHRQAENFDSTAINGGPGNSEILAVYTSPPAPVAVDERAEFVAWVRREWPQAPLSNVRDLLPKNDPRYGEYCDETLQRAWVGWQARAYLDKVKELNQ